MTTLGAAQLSSLSSSIEELGERAARMAADLEGDHEAEAATALYEVERSLRMASRSMDRARRALGA